MKKTYWWRISIFILAVFVLLLGWFYDSYLCFSYEGQRCIFDKYRLIIFEPMVIFSFSLMIISFVLLFVSDKVFIKWSKFAIFWIILTILFISFSPTYSRNIIDIAPTKEIVSVWMSLIFVLISFIYIFLNRKK